MTTQTEPAPIAARRSPNSVCFGRLNTNGDTKSESQFKDALSLEEIDTAIDTALNYERFLARKQYRVRKLILDLEIKRDAIEEGMSRCLLKLA
ncbi:MAG: hypothetical protein GY792_02170 [Gammaproteobacteria bacterium]|nr:hypothetical protein [Gammaproteobacteria bacterium]